MEPGTQFMQIRVIIGMVLVQHKMLQIFQVVIPKLEPVAGDSPPLRTFTLCEGGLTGKWKTHKLGDLKSKTTTVLEHTPAILITISTVRVLQIKMIAIRTTRNE